MIRLLFSHISIHIPRSSSCTEHIASDSPSHLLQIRISFRSNGDSSNDYDSIDPVWMKLPHKRTVLSISISSFRLWDPTFSPNAFMTEQHLFTIWSNEFGSVFSCQFYLSCFSITQTFFSMFFVTESKIVFIDSKNTGENSIDTGNIWIKSLSTVGMESTSLPLDQ